MMLHWYWTVHAFMAGLMFACYVEGDFRLSRPIYTLLGYIAAIAFAPAFLLVAVGQTLWERKPKKATTP